MSPYNIVSPPYNHVILANQRYQALVNNILQTH